MFGSPKGTRVSGECSCACVRERQRNIRVTDSLHTVRLVNNNERNAIAFLDIFAPTLMTISGLHPSCWSGILWVIYLEYRIMESSVPVSGLGEIPHPGQILRGNLPP